MVITIIYYPFITIIYHLLPFIPIIYTIYLPNMAFTNDLPSGELTFCHGKSPFFMGNSTISMAIFNSYVSSPEDIHGGPQSQQSQDDPMRRLHDGVRKFLVILGPGPPGPLGPLGDGYKKISHGYKRVLGVLGFKSGKTCGKTLDFMVIQWDFIGIQWDINGILMGYTLW